MTSKRNGEEDSKERGNINKCRTIRLMCIPDICLNFEVHTCYGSWILAGFPTKV